MKKRLLLFSLLLICLQLFSQTNINYTPTDEIIRNPERGFYTQFTGYSNNTQGFPVMESIDGQLLDIFAADQQALMLRLYYIPEFVDAPISPEFMEYVQQDMDVVREKGFKCVLRFAYSILGSTHADTLDAPLNRVLEHIGQFKPLFQKNADVIAVMQAGLIGAYGEWATFNNVVPDFMDENEVRNLSGRKAVLDALLDAFPKERMVQLRTPYYKYAFYNWEGWSDDDEVFANPELICPLTNASPLNQDNAYNGSDLYRVAQHNDCFLASATDFGTYCDEMISESDWLANETRYTVMGGETCAPNAPRSNCSNSGGVADTELNLYHWSFLNSGYHPDVLGSWKAQNCYDDIARSLGYRFALKNGIYDQTAGLNEGIQLALNLENQGYAAPFNPRRVEFILRNTNTLETWVAPTEIDPRFWFKNTEIGNVSLSENLGIPAEMVPGNYELMLHLPDPMPSLYGNPNYSMRMANDGLWEEATGFNSLSHFINITENGNGMAYTGNQWFIPFGCNAGNVSAAEIEYCCDQKLALSVEQNSFLAKHTVGWVLTEAPLDNLDDLDPMTVIMERGPSIDFEIDCAILPGDFYLTPFLAINDHNYRYQYPELYQAYWGAEKEQILDLTNANIAYDGSEEIITKIEIFNQDDFFSNEDGNSDFVIVNDYGLTFTAMDIPTLPVGQPTASYEFTGNPNAKWNLRIRDNTSAIGGVFLIKLTVFVPFPTIDQNCNNLGNSILLTPKTGITIQFPQADTSACIDADPFLLSATPIGGTFSGNAISENIFDPSMGTLGANEITYAVANDCGDIFSQNFTINILAPGTGLCEVNSVHPTFLNKMKIMPNPASNYISLSNIPSSGNLEIRSMDGRLVYQMKAIAGSQNIPIEQLPPGAYSIHFYNEQQHLLERFIRR